MSDRAPRRSAEQWAELVTQFDQSSESVQAFCAHHNLGFSTFHKWRRRFATEPNPMTLSDTHKTGFVEALPSNDDARSVTLYIGPSMRLTLPLALGVERIADLTRAVSTRVGG